MSINQNIERLLADGAFEKHHWGYGKEYYFFFDYHDNSIFEFIEYKLKQLHPEFEDNSQVSKWGIGYLIVKNYPGIIKKDILAVAIHKRRFKAVLKKIASQCRARKTVY